MKVRDIMSRDVQVARSTDSLREVAARMKAGDFGFMPVTEDDRLIGTVTDRDLVVRGLADGRAPDGDIGPCVSRDLKTVRDGDDLQAVLDSMGGAQIRRLPVLDADDRLVGVVSLGDLADRVKERHVGETLEAISR
jgi:CBS domain-containing protein